MTFSPCLYYSPLKEFQPGNLTSETALRHHFTVDSKTIGKTEKTCEANPASENSSFIFTFCVKSVPLYHFKLAYVVLPMAVKEFFETHF